MRTIRQAKLLYPMHQGLKELALEFLEVGKPKPTSDYNQLMALSGIDFLANREKREVLAYLLHTGIFFYSDFTSVMLHVRFATVEGHDGKDFAVECLASLYESTPPATDLKRLLSFLIPSADVDNIWKKSIILRVIHWLLMQSFTVALNTMDGRTKLL